MKNKLAKAGIRFLAISSIILAVWMICFVWADMTSLINNQNNATVYYSNQLQKTYTFNITAGAFDIRQVNFSLSLGLTFVNDTNATNVVTGGSINGLFIKLPLTLRNLTFGDGNLAVMIAGTSKTFTFNATAAVDGPQNITLTTYDSSMISNNTIFNIITDTIAPNVSIATPIPDSNFSSRVVLINVSANDTNYNYTVITIYYLNYTQVNTITNNTGNATRMDFRTNLTVPADGVYRINATSYDRAGNVNVSNVTRIVVDTTAPTISMINPVNGIAINITNVTVIYTLNATIVNPLADSTNITVNGVYFNITNATAAGTFNSTYNPAIIFRAGIERVGNTSWSNSTGWNISYWADGTYYVTVYANDSLGNLNNTVNTKFYVDRAKPSNISTIATSTSSTTASFSINITDATSGVNSACTINRSQTTNVTSITGTGLNQNVTDTGLTCNTAYVYYISCNDSAGNINSTGLYSVTTSACADTTAASSSGGGLSANPLTLKASLTTEGSSTTRSLRKADAIKLTFANNENHTVTVDSIVNGSVTITVASTPQEITLNVGEIKKVDVDADGTYDISVKLNSIANKVYASLTITKISESYQISPVTPTGENVTDTTTGVGDKIADTIKSTSKTTWIIVIVVLLIIIAGAVYWFIKKK